MKWFLNLLLPKIKIFLICKLINEKDEIIKIINTKIDIPHLDEEEEKELLHQVYDCIFQVISNLEKEKK